MLTKIQVKNFRLLKDVELTFELDNPTVLIGPNGSGKSTVLAVLDFLQRAAHEGLQSAATAHGGVESIKTGETNESVMIATEWSFGTSPMLDPPDTRYELAWRFEFDVRRNGAVRLIRETLEDSANGTVVPLVTTDEEGTRTVHASTGETMSTVVRDSNKLAFEEVRDPSRFQGLELLRAIVLARVTILGQVQSAPTWMRHEGRAVGPRDQVLPTPDAYLGPDGADLSNVLRNLQTDSVDSWDELERAFRAEFPFVARIVFPATSGGRISFAIEDKRFGARKIFPSEMSDGMLTYLCLLVSVLNVRSGVHAFDEPDSNVHPSALRRFVQLAQRSTVQSTIVIVTHSSALLEHLADPAASIRVVESTKDGAIIRKLDREALAAWRAEYSLSEMRSVGLLDPPNSAYRTDA